MLADIHKVQFPPALRRKQIAGLKGTKTFVRLTEQIKVYARLFLKEKNLTTPQRANLSKWREELACAKIQVPGKHRAYFSLLAEIADEISVELIKSSGE